MANEIENSDVDIDDPIEEDQEQQRNFQQQTQSLRRLVKDQAKAKAKAAKTAAKTQASGQVGQGAKAGGRLIGHGAKTGSRAALSAGRLLLLGLRGLVIALFGTFWLWGPILVIIIIIMYIAVNACEIPGFSIITSAGSLFSDNLELVDQICGSLAT